MIEVAEEVGLYNGGRDDTTRKILCWLSHRSMIVVVVFYLSYPKRKPPMAKKAAEYTLVYLPIVTDFGKLMDDGVV